MAETGYMLSISDNYELNAMAVLVPLSITGFMLWAFGLYSEEL